MLYSFALHAETNHLALARMDPDGKTRIELRTLEGHPLGEIGADLLPLNPRWSPDGSTIAFDSNDGLIYLYRLGSTAPEPIVADPTLTAGFCQWSAEGRQLVYSAYGRAGLTPPRIFTIDLATRQITQLTRGHRTVDRYPHWAPSGRWAAYQRQDLDEPEIPMRAWVVSVTSSDCVPASKDWQGQSYVGRNAWSSDSTALLVTEPLQGQSRLRVIRIEDGAILWSYTSQTLQGGAFSPQGDRILCVCSDELIWFAYPEGRVVDRLAMLSCSPVRSSLTGPVIEFGAGSDQVYFLGADTRLYRWESGGECSVILQAEGEEGPARPDHVRDSYGVRSRDGLSVPVERFIPPHPRSPAILYVHGGPGEAIDQDDPFMLRLLTEGFEFVCAAYRGSSGYGREHEQANRGEYGRGDVWDIIAAAQDWKQGANLDRPLILGGYSYGGYLTMLALAQAEHLWSGGIVMYPVSGIHRMGLHEYRAFPSEPERRAEAVIERSPLAQARRIHGPLLILHGSMDTAASTGELVSIREDIVSQGGECELVVFPDDTHGLRRHRDEVHALAAAFLERFE